MEGRGGGGDTPRAPDATHTCEQEQEGPSVGCGHGGEGSGTRRGDTGENNRARLTRREKKPGEDAHGYSTVIFLQSRSFDRH